MGQNQQTDPLKVYIFAKRKLSQAEQAMKQQIANWFVLRPSVIQAPSACLDGRFKKNIFSA